MTDGTSNTLFVGERCTDLAYATWTGSVTGGQGPAGVPDPYGCGPEGCAFCFSAIPGTSDVPAAHAQQRRRARRRLLELASPGAPSSSWLMDRSGRSTTLCTAQPGGRSAPKPAAKSASRAIIEPEDHNVRHPISGNARWVGRLLLPLLLAGVCGCGRTATITGKVTCQGRPVRYGSVTFLSADKTVPSCAIESDGSYTIEGVPTGVVQVGVASPDPSRGRSTAAPQAGRTGTEARGFPRACRGRVVSAANQGRIAGEPGTGLHRWFRPRQPRHRSEVARLRYGRRCGRPCACPCRPPGRKLRGWGRLAGPSPAMLLPVGGCPARAIVGSWPSRALSPASSRILPRAVRHGDYRARRRWPRSVALRLPCGCRTRR